jgi:hypothetical protein
MRRPPVVSPDAGCSRSTLADHRPQFAARLRPGSLRSASLPVPGSLRSASLPVPVFDISQTEGDPLPEICTRLSGDDPLGAYAQLVQVASGIDFTVEDHVFEDETNGDCSHQSRRI